MNLDEEMLTDLDGFSWFGDIEEVWGDLAFNIYCSSTFRHAATSVDWMRYVNHLKVLGSSIMPTEKFCRRVALWLSRSSGEFQDKTVEDLTSEDLVALFLKGRLASIETVHLDDHNYAEAVKLVVHDRLWIGRGPEYALVYELLNHPQTGYTRLRAFVDELAGGNTSVPLVALSVVANHPKADSEILNWVAAAFDEAGLRGQPSILHPLPEQLGGILHERRDLLNLKWKHRHRKPVEADMRLFYLNGRTLDRRLLTSSYEDICHEAWWNALFLTPHREVTQFGGFRPYGARLEAGWEGMPPAVPLLLSLKLLDAVERETSLDRPLLSCTGLWVLPYLQGASRWLREQFGTEDIPLSWLLETLGVGEALDRETWNILSPGWLAQADKRIRLGLSQY